MMNSFFEKAQQFGKSFMLPIAVLPAAGLLLGIGGALSNPNTIKAYPFWMYHGYRAFSRLCRVRAILSLLILHYCLQ